MSERIEIKGKRGSVVFTIDEVDAFLLRNYSWSISYGKTNRPFLQRTVAKGVGEVITRVIAQPDDDEIVTFANGDSTDLRRSNLKCVKKSKSVAKATQEAIAKRVPGRIKYSMVLSDRSKIDGVMTCSDYQWNAISLILNGKVPAHAVIDVAQALGVSEE
jgi:hypothetical protein